jgi:hypothetical protein
MIIFQSGLSLLKVMYHCNEGTMYKKKKKVNIQVLNNTKSITW